MSLARFYLIRRVMDGGVHNEYFDSVRQPRIKNATLAVFDFVNNDRSFLLQYFWFFQKKQSSDETGLYQFFPIFMKTNRFLAVL